MFSSEYCKEHPFWKTSANGASDFLKEQQNSGEKLILFDSFFSSSDNLFRGCEQLTTNIYLCFISKRLMGLWLIHKSSSRKFANLIF